jgi:hypothetical protein
MVPEVVEAHPQRVVMEQFLRVVLAGMVLIGNHLELLMPEAEAAGLMKQAELREELEEAVTLEQ